MTKGIKTQIKYALLFVLFLLKIEQTDAYGRYPTDYTTCGAGCFEQSEKVNCITNDLKASQCCHYRDNSKGQTQCMNRFHTCSKGLNSNLYKMLTCPMTNCPNNNNAVNYIHTRMNERKYHQVRWSFKLLNSIGFNCRMQIQADSKLNGKMFIEILETGKQKINVFQQPRNFINKNTHGLLENGQIYTNRANGKFVIPSDWYFAIHYHVFKTAFWGSGKLIIKSWVEPFTAADEENLKNVWQPTGSYYLSAKKKAEIEQRKQDIINKKMKEAKEKADREQKKLTQQEEQKEREKQEKLAEIQIETEDARMREQKQRSATLPIYQLDKDIAEWEEPKGIYFNNAMIMLFVAFGFFVYYCGMCSGCVVLYKFRHKMPVSHETLGMPDDNSIVLEGKQLNNNGLGYDPFNSPEKQKKGDKMQKNNQDNVEEEFDFYGRSNKLGNMKMKGKGRQSDLDMSRMNNSNGKFLDADKDNQIVQQESDGPFDVREDQVTPDIGADNKFKFKNGNNVDKSRNPQDTDYRTKDQYNTGHNLNEEKKEEHTQEQFKQMDVKLQKSKYVRGQQKGQKNSNPNVGVKGPFDFGGLESPKSTGNND